MLERQRRLDGNKLPHGHSAVFCLSLHALDSISKALGLVMDDMIWGMERAFLVNHD